MMKRILAGMVVVLALWAGQASAALTWAVVNNDDCSGLAAASGLTSDSVNCCTAADHGFCNRLENFGAQFVKYVTLAVPGAAAYTAGGDALSSTVLGKIGLNTITSFECTNPPGYVVKMVRTSATNGFKVALFYGNYDSADGALIDVVGNVANVAMDCIVTGR